jgi:hypothetical protein
MLKTLPWERPWTLAWNRVGKVVMISIQRIWVTAEAPTVSMKLVLTMMANQEVLSRIWTLGNVT